MSVLKIPQSFADEMIEHSLEDYPNEACGIIAAESAKPCHLYRMHNVEASPYRYSMDPKELYLTYKDIEQDHNWEVYAIYHSHTHSEAYPSATDVRLATWPEAFYILVSLKDKENPVMRAFNILCSKIEEAEIFIEE
jgi:proteasome lid subunit RPN8/RPN11